MSLIYSHDRVDLLVPYGPRTVVGIGRVPKGFQGCGWWVSPEADDDVGERSRGTTSLSRNSRKKLFVIVERV